MAAAGRAAPPQRWLAAPLDADPGADAEPIPGPLVDADLQPMIPVANLVEQASHWSAVGGEHDVDLAVVVDITERGAAADLRARERRACGRARVLEAAA